MLVLWPRAQVSQSQEPSRSWETKHGNAQVNLISELLLALKWLSTCPHTFPYTWYQTTDFYSPLSWKRQNRFHCIMPQKSLRSVFLRWFSVVVNSAPSLLQWSLSGVQAVVAVHQLCCVRVTVMHPYNPFSFLNPNSNSHPPLGKVLETRHIFTLASKSLTSPEDSLEKSFNVYPSRLGVTECHISKGQSYCRIYHDFIYHD